MKVTDTHVYFYTNLFSNWWSTRDIKPQFTDSITGVTFNNTEEAFMWYKAYFFGDEETAAKIAVHALERKHPSEVKALGRLVKNYDDKKWTTVREGFMTYVNLLKYQQNEWMLTSLKNTGDRVLVEASPVDRIWGVGLVENDPLILDEKNWQGLNLLGKSLMTVRNILCK
jgi:ribA/ribD-fused uncharacterized protein